MVCPPGVSEFPRSRVAAIEDLAARLFDRRKVGTASEALARDLLIGFHDVCTRGGLDRVLADLERELAPLDISDRSALADHAPLVAALV